MNDTNVDFTPAWDIVNAVQAACKKTFDFYEIIHRGGNQFSVNAYTTYSDPRLLVGKFDTAGARLVRISGGYGGWYDFYFEVFK